MTKSAFMPAPRPRLSEEDAQRLIDGASDLGFGRPSSYTPQPPSAPRAAPATPKPRPAAKAPKATPDVAEASRTLRFDVSDDLWTALKLASVHRRVTVRYLLLEALSKAGYAVDLDTVPEDGRRVR